jgi:hypothetical protein
MKQRNKLRASCAEEQLNREVEEFSVDENVNLKGWPPFILHLVNVENIISMN